MREKYFTTMLLCFLKCTYCVCAPAWSSDDISDSTPNNIKIY